MRRRSLFGALMFAPGASRAQSERRLSSIGILFLRTHSDLGPAERAMVPALAERGWIDGPTVRIEYRYADGNYSYARLTALTAELVAAKVDVIVAYATGVVAARRARATVPIVQATGGDPVALGYATSLAHPGGNVTGSAFFNVELMAKRLDILKQFDPALVRAGALLNKAAGGANDPVRTGLASAAKGLGLELEIVEVLGPEAFEATLAGWKSRRLQGVVVSDHNMFVMQANAETLARAAIAHRLPSIRRDRVGLAGALLAYGVDFEEQFRRASIFVDRILRGTKPAISRSSRPVSFVSWSTPGRPKRWGQRAGGAASPCRRGDRMIGRRTGLAAVGVLDRDGLLRPSRPR